MMDTTQFTVLQINEIKTEMQGLTHAIYGNGKEGLMTRTTVIENAILDIKKSEEKRSYREWSVIGGIAVLLLQTFWAKLF